MRSAILPLILLVSLLAGCAGQPAQRSDTDAMAGSGLDSFEGFSQALQQSMTTRDTALFVERLDTRQFARRSLASLGLATVKDETVNAYADVLGKAMKQRYKETFAQIESARFVRLMPADPGRPDEAISLMRIKPVDGGINYWKVYLQRSGGRISIVDWFSYSLGDLASRSLGGFVLQVGIAGLKPESPGADAIKAYLAAVQSNDPVRQLDAYQGLPVRMQSNSLLMFAHIQAAQRVSDEAYRNALTTFAPLYRKSDDHALMLVDYYLFDADYEQAHLAIDKVAANIGADSGLDNLHANIALQNGNYPRAIAYARDGIKRETDYEDNYWVLLDALVYSENYTDAVLVLNILEQGFNYRFDTRQMATLEGYQDFSRSDAFEGWVSAANH